MDVIYQLEDRLSVGEDEFLDLLARSGLAGRRPVDDPQTIRGMLKDADILITARVGAAWSASPGRSPTTPTAPTCPTWPWTRRSNAGASARN